MRQYLYTAILIFLIVALSCQTNNSVSLPETSEPPMLEMVPPSLSGIKHKNMVQEYENWNYLQYAYSYNGGGVAIGDINNDGLPDIFLSANQGAGALYLNKGNLEFEDITEKSGINTSGGWKTGVVFIDINGDGWLDLYVCRAGVPEGGDLRRNLVYINNRDLTFPERSRELGLVDTASSIGANFFDYDQDGDLDIFVVNHSTDFYLTNSMFFGDVEPNRPKNGRNNLYQQQPDGTFKEVSIEAGIANTPSFTLSATVLDFNKDGWPDLFVCNDFWESEYLYLNNQDGTFTNVNKELLPRNSMFSMGSDAGDFNNDGWLDLVSVDMLPNDNSRQKRLYNQLPLEAFKMLDQSGYHKQYSRNMFFYGSSDGTFIETGMMSGVEASDWSWGAVGADLDNDGWKDLVIVNGLKREVLDLDYTQKKFGEFDPMGIAPHVTNTLDIVQGMPIEWVPNFIFKNNQDLTFEDVSGKWGFTQPLSSQGLAMADLDNDGDLDVVISNTDTIASLYRNRLNDNNGSNFIRVKLVGENKNPFGIGAKVTVHQKDKLQYQELQASRGYQSSSEPVLHFGLGNSTTIDSVVVLWPGNKAVSVVRDVKSNGLITINQRESQPYIPAVIAETEKPFVLQESGFGQLKHTENLFDDFDVERLIPKMYSSEGPALAVADVNGDGNDDIFISGSKGHKSALWLSGSKGYQMAPSQPLNNDLDIEAINAVFFDANGDGHVDLYLAIGSNEYNANDACQQDRLYLNDGNGKFDYVPLALPAMHTSTKAVAVGDIDADGDLDLFVGGFIEPRAYGVSPRSYVLINNDGVFSDETAAIAPDLLHPGMLNTAIWADMDGDKVSDLVLGGEYMPISIFTNKNGKLSLLKTPENGLDQLSGWWHSIEAHDFDGDGDLDLIAGNHGTNVIFDCSIDAPTILFANDFDNNGSIDPIITCDIAGVRAPFMSRDLFCEQMPEYNNKFLTNKQFATLPFDSFFTEKLFSSATKMYLTELRSGYFENLGSGKFAFKPFLPSAQGAPIYGIQLLDANNDDHMDVLVAGNSNTDHYLYGHADASRGLLLINDGSGKFSYNTFEKTGFKANKFARGIVKAQINGHDYYIVPNNNADAQVFKFTKGLLN